MTVLHFSRAILETARTSAVTVVDAARGRLTFERSSQRLDVWSRRLVEQAKITVVPHHAERLETDETFVVMSNHQSLYDVPVLFRVFRDKPLRMIAKRELFRVPLWGRAMREAGFFEIDRSNRERAIEALQSASRDLASGVSIWIAPEGTRSETGALNPFKRGGFRMALETGKRILPVAVDGTRDALVARGFRVTEGAVAHVTICEPVDPADYGFERRDELSDRVRDAIAAYIPEEGGKRLSAD